MRDAKETKPSKYNRKDTITEVVAALSGRAQVLTRWGPRVERRNGQMPHA